MSAIPIDGAIAHDTFAIMGDDGMEQVVEMVLYDDADLTVCRGSVGGCIDLNDDSVGDLLDGIGLAEDEQEQVWSFLEEHL